MATSGVFARGRVMHPRGDARRWKGGWRRTRVSRLLKAQHVLRLCIAFVCRVSIIKGCFERWLIMHQNSKLTRFPLSR